MLNRRMVLCTMYLSVLAAASPALAHHGFGTFDMQKSVTLTGKLTRIEMINPHSWLYFEATDEKGKVTKYRCEMRSAHTLRRSGWTQDLFPTGQRVVIDAQPDRADPNSCYLNTIKFENGTSMDRYGQYVKAGKGQVKEVRGQVNAPDTSKRAARRPSGEPNIAGDWAPEQVVMADPRGRGGSLVPLSRIGERPTDNAPAAAPGAGGARAGREGGAAPAAGGRGGGRGGLELTELGKAAASKFTRDSNPRFRCETTSILFDWTFDGPVNRITQNRDNIVIQYGQMNLRRVVYTTAKTHPTNIKPSRAGHSIGRWEGDVLVVDTVSFLPGILTGNTPHGEKLHVVERFSLDPQTMRLTRQYTAEDSDYFKGQYTGQDVVQVADAPYTEDKCKDLQFVDYSKEQSQRR
jgi:hypothetical protein